MNRATPIVLLLLLLAAGTYVALFEIRRESRFWTAAEFQERKTRVFDVERSDALLNSVRELTVCRDNETLALSRLGQTVWLLTGPVRGPARDGLVNGLVGGLLFMKKVGDEIPPQDFPPTGRAAYGLDKPRIVVTLSAGEGEKRKEYSLSLGSDDPTGQYVYAQRPGDAGVMLLEKGSVELLSRPVNDYRETRFVRLDAKRVLSFRVRSPASEVELAREGDTWTVTKPCHDRADSLRTEDVLRAVADCEATSFAAEEAGNLAPFGLDRPDLQVAFTRDDNTTSTVLIGKAAREPVGTVYVKLAGESTIYTTNADVVGKLTFRADFLRDRTLARFASTSVQEFSIEGAGPKVLLRKADTAWKVVEPVKVDAQEDAVDSFLRALAALDVIRFPNDSPDAAALGRFALDEKSRITVTLKVADKPEQVYTFGNIDPKEKDLYARRSGSDCVYTVREGFREGVTGTYLEFRKREVAELSRFNVQKLVLRRPQGDVTLAKAADDKWRLTAPVSAACDEVNVGNLLDSLNKLEAVRFLSDKSPNPAAFALDKPAYQVTIELKAGKDKPVETKTLLVGKDMGTDGWTAKLADSDLVFTVPGTLVEHLGQEFRRRLVWEIKAGDLSKVVWQKGSEKVVVRKEEGGWKLIEPSGRTLNEQAVTQMVSAVDYLRADRFESYTRDNLSQFGLDKPRLTLTLTVQDKDRTLLIGRDKDKDRVSVCVSDDDGVFTMPASTVKMLLESPLGPVEPAK